MRRHIRTTRFAHAFDKRKQVIADNPRGASEALMWEFIVIIAAGFGPIIVFLLCICAGPCESAACAVSDRPCNRFLTSTITRACPGGFMARRNRCLPTNRARSVNSRTLLMIEPEPFFILAGDAT